jgi:hypothetical protein
MIGGNIDRILKAADVVSEVRKAFEKIQQLEAGQRHFADALVAIDARVRELEAGLREGRSEIKLSAVQAAQDTVNSAQGPLYQRLLDIEVRLVRVAGDLESTRWHDGTAGRGASPSPDTG